MTTVLVAVTFLAALGSGIVGGLFYAFSSFVMTALGRLPPDKGIAAMQSINVSVLNPWFFSVFFGTAIVCLVLVVLVLAGGTESGSAWVLAGSALYLGGCILVTIVCNVPLNGELARVSSESAEGADVWARYLRVWTAWNHVRTIASLAAMAAFVAALLPEHVPGD